ncbi:MAG TPA: hypothetical protein VHD83_10975 [Puia sp.]|nr:hypothetical protein [Puia sp.]
MRPCITIFFLTILFSACAKDHTGPSNNPVPEGADSGAVTGAGATLGTVIVKTIGSDGGTLVSDDQRLTVYVPAGATSQTQNITLERISNQAPNGLGDAYRIKPASTVQKPFKLCWKYKNNVLQGAKPNTVAIAYQDTKGIWHASRQTSVDEQDSTICVELRTGQTQDVSFICETIITPRIREKKWILTAEPIFIDITRVPIRGNWEQLPAATIVKDDIQQLSLNGGDPNDGSLNNGTVSEAAYGAPHSLLYVGPQHTPNPNPVVVRAKVQGALGPVTVTTSIPVDQDLLMESTVGGLTNPMSIFTASEGGNLSVSMWSDTDAENSPNVATVTVTGFTKNKLVYTSGATCEFQLAGGGKTYSSVYYPLDEHGTPVKTYGTGTLTIRSITALVDHPGVGIIMGTFEAEVFRPIGGNQYERGTVSTHFQMVGGYIP